MHEGTEYGTVVINRTKLGTVHSVLYGTPYCTISVRSTVSISAGVTTPVSLSFAEYITWMKKVSRYVTS